MASPREAFLQHIEAYWAASKPVLKSGLEYASLEAEDHFIAYSGALGSHAYELEDYSFILRRRLGLLSIPEGETASKLARYLIAVPSEEYARNLFLETIRATIYDCDPDGLYQPLPAGEAITRFEEIVRDGLLTVYIYPQACQFPLIIFEPMNTQRRVGLITAFDQELGLRPLPLPKAYIDHYYETFICPLSLGEAAAAGEFDILGNLKAVIASGQLDMPVDRSID